ncbi:hypothetical protein [Nocardia goodfellowii]|uniref:Acyl-CoA reductase-like NAD-dependent aldehyde dehydrogenase n=1 Tax=Nocardia goodfellowii TaxID=882446 RepID=A0ABS4QMM1_9NOCA|nr:hypothetical protein [Nocardia goodfellowii]MBP2192942.1 acyl-CoA reductase-like NAD-dependent aldehyde dehydrogenase [Nocardia goodfellowii]
MTLRSVMDERPKRLSQNEAFVVFDPATGEQTSAFTDRREGCANDAVGRVKSSFEASIWREVPARERAKIMWRIPDLSEAVAMANDSTYVLEAMVWTINLDRRGHRLAKRAADGRHRPELWVGLRSRH